MTKCCARNINDTTECSYPTAILSHQLSTKQKKQKGTRAMARMNFDCLPQGNPCAQCGKPIATPEWIESGPQRTSYLWHCWACDYQFEAVAFFEDSEADPEALAA
jgi:hypothetical protein